MALTEFKYRKLRGRIIEKYGTYRNFANALGVNETVVSRKLTGVIGITTKDIIEWGKLLDVEQAEIGILFFEDEFSKREQGETS